MASQVSSNSIFLIIFLHSYLISSNKLLPNTSFLNSISPISESDNIEDIHQLEEHLTYLRYFNYNNKIFKNSLEFVLRKHQIFHRPNITGDFDTLIVAKLPEPRYHIVSRYTFIPGRPRWRKTRLKYAFNKNVKEEAIQPLERAMKEWASVTLFKFIRVKTVAIADIRFSFMSGDHGDGLPFDGSEPKGGVAHSFPPPDGRVHFDAAQKWSGRGERDGFDIETVGLHELGHVLGLGHSGVQGAVMYPVISHAERKHLHEDDVKGIKALYKLK